MPIISFGSLEVWAEIPTQSPRKVFILEEIQLTGVTIFDQNDIEETISIFPGERIEMEDIDRNVLSLTSLYRSRGYREAQIRSTLLRNNRILVLAVQEGKPTRVASVTLSPSGLQNDDKQKDWIDIRDKLNQLLIIQPGDILNQERISEMNRLIEGALNSEEFIGARLKDVRTLPTIAPEKLQESVKSDAASWVNLSFVVDLGDDVSFGFRGNETLNQSDLMQVVNEQIVIGLGKDYVRAIAEALKKSYRERGFAKVEIRWRTYETPDRRKRRVSYIIEEGPRVRVGSVEFDGNLVFEDSQLREVFEEGAGRFFVESQVDSSANRVLDWIKSNGYLSAKIINVARVDGESPNEINITVYLYEGEQTLVRNVSIEGNQSLSQQKVRDLVSIEESQPLNLFAFSAGIEDLKNEYREMGYLNIRIINENQDDVVRYFQKNKYADVTLIIDEGPLFKAGKVEVEGLTRTDLDVVERELEFEDGEVLSQSQIARSESNLRKLGIFSTIEISLEDDPTQFDRKRIKVRLSEAGRIRIGFGVGIRNDLGIRGFSEAAYTNLWKRNHTWSVDAEVNRRLEDFRFFEFKFRMAYQWPWFYLDKLTFRPQISLQRRQYILFSADTIGLKTTWERPIWEAINLIGSLSYELEQTRQFDAQISIDNQSLRIGAVTPSVRIDLRDSPLNPTSGFFSSASYEIALPAFGSSGEGFPVGYTRFQYRADGFIPLAKGVVWFLSFRTGFEKNLIDPDDFDAEFSRKIGIPLSKQFALGGAGSIRGFKLQELNFQDITIRGSLSYVNYRTQLDLPLAGDMKFGPFVDAGNLTVDSFTFGNLRFGVGVGLHYQTPVGPVNFDWGFKIDPQPGEDTSRFHFTVGIL